MDRRLYNCKNNEESAKEHGPLVESWTFVGPNAVSLQCVASRVVCGQDSPARVDPRKIGGSWRREDVDFGKEESRSDVPEQSLNSVAAEDMLPYCFKAKGGRSLAKV